MSINSNFQRVSPQYAVDESSGISVEVTGPYSIRYSDNGYVLNLDTEPLKDADNYKICLFLSELMKWESPSEQSISDHEKHVIEAHVKNAMNALGVCVEVA